MRKDGTYTFKHFKEANFSPKTFTPESAKDAFIEALLNKGYLPTYTTSVMYNDPRLIEPIIKATAMCAYFGKKTARLKYEEYKELVEKEQNIFHIPIDKNK